MKPKPTPGKKLFNKVTPFKGGKITVQFNEVATAQPVTIQIYEDIGEDPWTGEGLTARDFAEALSDVPRDRSIDLRINSAGGNCWDGMAIKTLIDQWPGRKTASIDGMAASVASWLPMGCDEVRAPRHAQMFIHPAWGMVAGNANDLRSEADKLDKTTSQIADIYARKTGINPDECLEMMMGEAGAGKLMTAEEAHALGFIDRLTDDRPVSNFSENQLGAMRRNLATLNSLRNTAPTGNDNIDEMKKQLIALLNKWGVKFDPNATEEQLNLLVEKGKPRNDDSMPMDDDSAVKYKPGSTEHADDCNCSDCKAAKNAPDVDPAGPGAKPDHEPPGKKGDESSPLWTGPASVNRMEKMLRTMANQARNAIRGAYNQRIKAVVEADKIPAGQMGEWLDDAMNAYDAKGEEAAEKLMLRLEGMPGRPPGIAPVNITVGESSSIDDLNIFTERMMEPQLYFSMNRGTRPNKRDCETIAENTKRLSSMLNSLKKYDAEGNLTGPVRAMWDSWAAMPETSRFGGGFSAVPHLNQQYKSPRNANTMSSGLLRQVILSEVMRAFRRRLVPLTFFAHNFNNVPLEGTDVVQVPYYPLDTVASSDFVQSTGYQITPNAQTLSKSITVGGQGPSMKTAGIGRKYKGLQFSAYEIRRQPWLDIQKLTVMAGEQLALDVLNDIITANISAANFGTAVFSGPSAAFTANVVAQQLQVAANRADWPVPMRNLILDTAYYANLISDPDVKAFLSYGDTGPIREARLAGIYGFEQTVQNPRIPNAANGFTTPLSGTAGTTNDPQLIGWMCWPSAILVATAPIMPAPGEMLRLVTYESVADDQTGLTFSYKYWGDPMFSTDYEIIECSYGSGLGELAALKRLVSSGT